MAEDAGEAGEENAKARALTLDLPEEVWQTVLTWLPPRDLASPALVCSRWAALSTRDDTFWRRIIVRGMGESVGKPPGGKTWLWLYRSKMVDIDNLPNRRTFTGVGRLCKPGDLRYEGDLVNGLSDGFGTLQHVKGACYVGEFRQDQRHGKGKQVWSDKEYLEGEWENNEPHGFGVKMWATGDVYKGQWVAGKRIGYGEYEWPSGHRYMGVWKDMYQDGRGVYSWPDGRRYDGEWKDGEKDGYGTYCWPEGCTYTGNWKQGRRHGLGEMRWDDGSRFVGAWDHDIRLDSGQCFDAAGKPVPGFRWGSKSYDDYFSLADAQWDIKYRHHLN